MDILIKGMDMPESGVYEISIDNTNERDKTIMTVYKREDDGFIHVFDSYEIISVPPHGRLIDADELMKRCVMLPMDGGNLSIIYMSYLRNAPTVIEAEE